MTRRPLRQWWRDVSFFHRELADELRGRGVAYNIAAVWYLALAVLLAYRLSELYAFLAVLLGLSALGAVGLVVVFELSVRRFCGPYPDSADLSAGQVPDRSRTAVRTGVRTALTAAPDSLADRTADSGQAVRVQVADR